MKTKIIPFDLETAKKIQSGEIKGKIMTNNGYAVRIICFDKRTSSGYPILGLVDYPNQSEMCKAFNVHGLCYDQPVEYVLQIELPEETEIVENGDYVEVINAEHLTGQKGVAEIMTNAPFPFVCGINQGKLGTFYVYDRSKLKILKKYNEVTSKHEFKPFDKVLVRDNEKQVWLPRLFDSHVEQGKFWTQDGKSWEMCIPYEGNEYLVDITEKPNEE